MEGMRAAKRLVADYLEANLATQLAVIEETQGVEPGSIPRPKSYHRRDHPGPTLDNQWPAVVVQGTDMTGQTEIGLDADGFPVYERNYRMRAYVWARGADHDETDERRDLLTMALVQALLLGRKIGPGAPDGPTARILPTTMTEGHSDLEKPANSDRSIGAAYVAFDMRVEETIPVAPIAVAEEVTVDEKLLPPPRPSGGGIGVPPVIRPTYNVPPGIAHDGSANETHDLNAWLATVPDGTIAALESDGLYRSDYTLTLLDRHGLLIEGNGARLKAVRKGEAGRNHVELQGGSSLVVQDLIIEGVNTDPLGHFNRAYFGQHGVTVRGVQGCTLQRVTIEHVYGDFVMVTPDTLRSQRWSSDVSVVECTFDHAGRQGVSITGGQRILVADNHIFDVGIDLFDVEPDAGTGHESQPIPTGGGVRDLKILRNDVSHGLFFNSTGNHHAIARDIEIADNVLHDQPMNVWIEGWRDNHKTGISVHDNTADRAYGNPDRGVVELLYVDGAIIRANKAHAAAGVEAVRIYSCTDVDVRLNDFKGAHRSLLAEGRRFGAAWTGPASTGYRACGNTIDTPGRIDEPCAA